MKPKIPQITSLTRDPVRNRILSALLDGRAYTAIELAIIADTSPHNIRVHLNKLVQADLLAVESQGRHQYYRLSKPELANAMEATGSLIQPERHKKVKCDNNNADVKYCRSCYNHLAGKVGVALTDALLQQKIIALADNQYEVTKKRVPIFDALDIHIDELKKHRRIFAKPCLDWSERKHHIAGSLGVALLDKMIALDYLRRTKNSRAILVTSKGQAYLYNQLKLSI